MPLHSDRFPAFRLLTVLLLSMAVTVSSAQTTEHQVDTAFNISSKAFYLPARTPNGDFRHMISITRYFLPSDWTNVAINAPMFNYSARYSLPAGFSVQGDVSTLFISNRFAVGPRWTWSKNHFHVGAMFQYAFNIGFLYEWGFTTQVTGWSKLPSISVGYSWKQTSITMRVGREFLGKIRYQTGENVMTTSDFKLNGNNFALILEQRLVKNHLMTFAFEMDHVNFVMVAWPAFPVNSKTYYVPQVIWGYTF